MLSKLEASKGPLDLMVVALIRFLVSRDADILEFLLARAMKSQHRPRFNSCCYRLVPATCLNRMPSLLETGV